MTCTIPGTQSGLRESGAAQQPDFKAVKVLSTHCTSHCGIDTLPTGLGGGYATQFIHKGTGALRSEGMACYLATRRYVLDMLTVKAAG